MGALTSSMGLTARLFHSIGFLNVILERVQLFNTHTVTPMLVGLQKPNATLSRYTAEG